MPMPPNPSGDEDGSLLANSPSRSLPEVRFSWFLVSLNVVSLFRFRVVKVFKELRQPGPRMVGWYGHATVPLVVKFRFTSFLISFLRADVESPLLLDFFMIFSIIGHFPINANISSPVSNPKKTHK